MAPPVRRRISKPTLTLARPDDDQQVESIDHVASSHRIPLFDVRRPLQGELVSAIRQFAPDLIVASCFPWRIPSMIRDEATFGGLNLHPSRLPLHRGPDPLFWTFYAAERSAGVTVHEISDVFDAGAIYAQSESEISDELPGDQLEALLAEAGASLLVDVIDQLGTVRFRARSQDDSQASYQSWPSRKELEIDRAWDVQRVINFIAGVIPLGYEPWIKTDRGDKLVRAARRMTNSAGAPIESWPDNQSEQIAVKDGMVELKIG